LGKQNEEKNLDDYENVDWRWMGKSPVESLLEQSVVSGLRTKKAGSAA
jgi:hypothetical protein